MLYFLFQYLDMVDFPGAGMFQFISFRSAMAFITSLGFALLVGKRLIRYLQIKQIGEEIRDLGLEGQMQKKGTPTMGGIIILASNYSAGTAIWRFDEYLRNHHASLLPFGLVQLDLLTIILKYSKRIRRAFRVDLRFLGRYRLD